MSKQAVFTMKLESELRAEFISESQALHRPASQVLRELMREFIQRQRETRAYDNFLNKKVDKAKISMEANEGHDNHSVEKDFAAKRNKLLGSL